MRGWRRSLQQSLRRGLAAGAAGTTAMSLTELAHHLARPKAPRPIDYDVSDAVVTAAARVLHVHVGSPAQARVLFVVTHAGYGTAFGMVEELLVQAGVPPRIATGLFYVGTQTMALALFPILGGTPPPWRWQPEPLVTSLVQHAIYAATVGAVQRRL